MKRVETDLETFDTAWKNVGTKLYIDIHCADCGVERTSMKEKVREGILKKGRYLCRSCSMKDFHQNSGHTPESKRKISEALSGIVRSPETRQKMSDKKKAFFKTPAGEAAKKRLSFLMSQSQTKMLNSKRSGWFKFKKPANPVFYASSYELRLCYDLDNDDSVATFETQLGFEINGRGRCLDNLVTYKDGSQKAIEVKDSTRMGESLIVQQVQDSDAYAAEMGWNFEIVTEKTMGMTYEEIRDWADNFRTENSDFDWIAYRKAAMSEKSKRFYKKNIATDKVVVWCDYCQKNHEPLRLTYDKNIERNGKYICERKGGSISGKKPKPKKENPYAAEGKKQCNGPCGEIKLMSEFGTDKAKSDGLATQCKSCRTKKAMEKYNAKKKD